MSEVTEDLGYKVEKVKSTRIEAKKVDETFKSSGIGAFDPSLSVFGGVGSSDVFTTFLHSPNPA